MKDKEVIITAIVGLVIIESIALSLGFNGQILRYITITIAGLAGLAMPQPNKIMELIKNDRK
jgi:uncharacterized membrane protein|tara:strand:+ start:5696 stop:5881 length:186 start_codon:yes stop_codon:yes gene_type:complete